MVTEEERREIIEQAKEEFLVMIPEVIGNLMANHAALTKMNSQFYKDHPELVEHKMVVASVLEEVDGKDPLATYEEKLKRSIPIIQSRLQQIKGMDMTKVQRLTNRDFSDFGSNGAL